MKGIKMTKTKIKAVIREAGYIPHDELVEIVGELHGKSLNPKLVKAGFALWQWRKAKAGEKATQEPAPESEQAKSEGTKATENPATETAAVIQQPPAAPEVSNPPAVPKKSKQ